MIYQPQSGTALPTIESLAMFYTKIEYTYHMDSLCIRGIRREDITQNVALYGTVHPFVILGSVNDP